MPNPKYYQITLPSGSTQIWDEEKVNRNRQWLENKKATSEEVNKFEVTLPSGSSQTWDADKYSRNIDWLNEHKAQVRGLLIEDQTAARNEQPFNAATFQERRRQIPSVDFSPMPEEYRTSHANQDPGASASTVPAVETPEPSESDKPSAKGSFASSWARYSSGIVETSYPGRCNRLVDRYNKQQEDAEKESWFKRLLRSIGENYAPHGDVMIPAMRETKKMYHGAGVERSVLLRSELLVDCDAEGAELAIVVPSLDLRITD